MSMSRRTVITRAPIIAATGLAGLAAGSVDAAGLSAVSRETTEKDLRAYNHWLFYERKFLAEEMFPSIPDPWLIITPSGIASEFHFPRWDNGPRWQDVPKPSTRAVPMLRLLGIID